MTDVNSIYFAPDPDNFFSDDRMISLCWIRIILFLFAPEMDDFCYKGCSGGHLREIVFCGGNSQL